MDAKLKTAELRQKRATQSAELKIKAKAARKTKGAQRMDEEFDVPETDTDLPGDPMTEMMEQLTQQVQHQSEMVVQAFHGVMQSNQQLGQLIQQLAQVIARPRRRIPIRNDAGDITEVRDALED